MHYHNSDIRPWVQIGKLIPSILDNCIRNAERIMSKQPQSVISQVHKDFRIPEGYYIAPVSTKSNWLPPVGVKAPPITQEQRDKAVLKLVEAKVITAPTIDAVLKRLCARLETLPGYLDANGRRPQDTGPTPIRKLINSQYGKKRRRVMDLIAENPQMSIKQLAEAAQCSKQTVSEVRQKLRQEGKL